jgi:hypothetical protein
MNYVHISDHFGRWAAALLPIAGVALLESLLSEARRAHERRHGRDQRSRIHPLRFVFDWAGTWKIIGAQVTAVPQADRMALLDVEAVDTSVAAGVHAGLCRIPMATPAQRHPATPIALGQKTATMRALFETYRKDGRLAELNGSVLAAAAGAHASLGRRNLRRWLNEFEDAAS